MAPEGVFVFDKELLNTGPELRSWLESLPRSYQVSAGESLKDIHKFPAHIEKILDLVDDSSAAKAPLVAIGGGSVGDFTGFAASVLKRGLPLVQVPSTLLAAIDSAHGGKTALNCRGAKNQIGSFYPAQDVFIVKPLLAGLPKEQLEDGFGELFKMGLLAGGDLWENLEVLSDLSLDSFWPLLPKAIEAKYQVVRQDPYEKSGLRHCLNLGHTVGHIWEATSDVSHGKAVALGLVFTLELSKKRGFLKQAEYERVVLSSGYRLLKSVIDPITRPQLSRERTEELLRRDKKRAKGDKVQYVFLERPGGHKMVSLTYAEILDELEAFR